MCNIQWFGIRFRGGGKKLLARKGIWGSAMSSSIGRWGHYIIALQTPLKFNFVRMDNVKRVWPEVVKWFMINSMLAG